MNECKYETFKLSDMLFRMCLEVCHIENKESNSNTLNWVSWETNSDIDISIQEVYEGELQGSKQVKRKGRE